MMVVDISETTFQLNYYNLQSITMFLSKEQTVDDPPIGTSRLRTAYLEVTMLSAIFFMYFGTSPYIKSCKVFIDTMLQS